jgi:hypothetical protein
MELMKVLWRKGRQMHRRERNNSSMMAHIMFLMLVKRKRSSNNMMAHIMLLMLVKRRRRRKNNNMMA